MKRLKAATMFIWDIWRKKTFEKKIEKSSKVEIFTKVKIQRYSLFLLITFCGHPIENRRPMFLSWLVG